ncbi:LysR family transcriptional regulator [Massilia sp. TSP1-1-2]|uniref:LysR family transcriptional regulator n=1 Tax=Massilia sp. TSP1-1-2 TaxID=2804649 RepID=UPI003CF054EF
MALRFKLRQLEMFVAVAETLNFREAAARLHMTQPPLSRQISELEGALGIKLLERSNQGASLTAPGARFLDEARTLLAACDAMGARFCGSLGPVVDTLRVGVTTVVDTGTLQQLLPVLEAAMPGLERDFKRQGSVRSVRDLLQHRLDAAIIGMPTETADVTVLTVRQLYRDQFCVALPASHRLRKRKVIGLGELNDDLLFWFKRDLNPGFYDACEAVFRQAGYAPQRAPEPADHHVLLSLIANQGGVALIARSLCNIRRSGVVYRDLKESELLFIDVSVAYLASAGKAALPRFVEQLVRFYGNGEEGRAPA